MDFVAKTGAIPFDTGTGIELDHYEKGGIKHCTFDAIVRRYDLAGDTALTELQKVVRAADTSGGLEREPLAWGLEVIASGMPLLCKSDHEALEKEFPMYDAFYAFMQRRIVLDTYASKIEKLKSRGERQELIKTKISQLPSKKIK